MSIELSTVIYSNKEQLKIVAENSMRMLDRRYNIKDRDNLIKEFHKLIDQNINTMDVKHNNNIYSLIIINSKITNISQLEEFLKKDTQKHKLLFVQSLTKKIYKQAITTYEMVEVFLVEEFLEDIPSKNFVPKHQLLKSEDKDFIVNSFNLVE